MTASVYSRSARTPSSRKISLKKEYSTHACSDQAESEFPDLIEFRLDLPQWKTSPRTFLKGSAAAGGLSDRTTEIRQFFSKLRHRRRGGRIWRLDCARTAEKRRERHVAGRVGTGKLAGQLWRRDANHSRHIRCGTHVHRNGSAGLAAVERLRAATESQAVIPNRRALDGRER